MDSKIWMKYTSRGFSHSSSKSRMENISHDPNMSLHVLMWDLK